MLVVHRGGWCRLIWRRCWRLVDPGITARKAKEEEEEEEEDKGLMRKRPAFKKSVERAQVADSPKHHYKRKQEEEKGQETYISCKLYFE